MWRATICFFIVACGVFPASARDLTDPNRIATVFDELRFGLHGYDVHNAMLPFLVNEWRVREIQSLSFDILFVSPEIDAFRWLGSPRPEIGTTAYIGPKETLIHAGFTWQLPVFDTPLYLEGTFGAAIHSGHLSGASGQKNFGCRVNFYERFGVGANITENATLTLTYEHTSNNGWCSNNAGLSNFGARLGWKF